MGAVFLFFIFPIAIALLFYFSKGNVKKLSDKGVKPLDNFGSTLFKVIGVIVAILSYVIFMHERDEAVKQRVDTVIHGTP